MRSAGIYQTRDEEAYADEFYGRVDKLMSRFPFYGREKAENIARDEMYLRDLLGDDMGDRV